MEKTVYLEQSIRRYILNRELFLKFLLHKKSRNEREEEGRII